MDSLPVVPATCTLDRPGQEAQVERYRAAGVRVTSVQREPQQLIVRFDGFVVSDELDELMAVERKCCPFFNMDWAADERVLTISVARAEEAPALDAIAFALGVRVGDD